MNAPDSAHGWCLPAWYTYLCECEVTKPDLCANHKSDTAIPSCRSLLKTGQLVEHNANSGLRDNKKDNRRVSHKADMGPANRFELFLLDEGQQKVEEKAETRVPNTAVFTFNKEDHTLGNLLSARLQKNPAILFAAYKEAVIRTCTEVITELSKLNDSFQTEWLGKRIVSEGEAERLQREQNNF
ncbi:RNA polymerase II subunit [Pyrenophora tritici-repentis Pt-1C-BFP]|uniref:RNA polymerase II subunit n=1 Tax=Pyrenophora tritici-repentis (strain Pt-1C-BFP) TaxID=426418 RepID=B2WFP6_PYRTR|nr:RNA polymerase II subunit [Pyrenophora tritici-repentis Pt-1C-BFP]EDU41803.1 RNA polymerase II subunit [Pyrenophora tritici-repentis Pt-1C-BFP]